jgi:hypothetical protein
MQCSPFERSCNPEKRLERGRRFSAENTGSFKSMLNFRFGAILPLLAPLGTVSNPPP